MTTVKVDEQITDEGHGSASEAAREAEADHAEVARTEGESRKRSPVYHVFERDRTGDNGLVDMFQRIASDVNAPTDRKAIESVIGTAERPVPGFDEDRRLHEFVAVLTRQWEPLQRKRTVTEEWA